MRFALDDVIRLESYSIQKLLSLYDITLKPYLEDDLISTWLCEDQMKFSEPYKRVFLKQTLKNGIIKCNTIVKVIMVSIHDKKKRYIQFFKQNTQ